MYKYLLILVGGIAVMLAGVCWLLSSGDDAAMQIHHTPVAYLDLEDYEKDDVPPFAYNIYRASFVDWQVGEWAWRFDVPAGSEAQLKEWCAAIKGKELQTVLGAGLFHLEAPEWWARPADAQLILGCEKVPQPLSVMVWFSPSQNRVWIRYAKW